MKRVIVGLVVIALIALPAQAQLMKLLKDLQLNGEVRVRAENVSDLPGAQDKQITYERLRMFVELPFAENFSFHSMLQLPEVNVLEGTTLGEPWGKRIVDEPVELEEWTVFVERYCRLTLPMGTLKLGRQIIGEPQDMVFYQLADAVTFSMDAPMLSATAVYAFKNKPYTPGGWRNALAGLIVSPKIAAAMMPDVKGYIYTDVDAPKIARIYGIRLSGTYALPYSSIGYLAEIASRGKDVKGNAWMIGANYATTVAGAGDLGIAALFAKGDKDWEDMNESAAIDGEKLNNIGELTKQLGIRGLADTQATAINVTITPEQIKALNLSLLFAMLKNTETKKKIGNEIDFVATYKIAENIDAHLLYARLSPKEALAPFNKTMSELQMQVSMAF